MAHCRHQIWSVNTAESALICSTRIPLKWPQLCSRFPQHTYIRKTHAANQTQNKNSASVCASLWQPPASLNSRIWLLLIQDFAAPDAPHDASDVRLVIETVGGLSDAFSVFDPLQQRHESIPQ